MPETKQLPVTITDKGIRKVLRRIDVTSHITNSRATIERFPLQGGNITHPVLMRIRSQRLSGHLKNRGIMVHGRNNGMIDTTRCCHSRPADDQRDTHAPFIVITLTTAEWEIIRRRGPVQDVIHVPPVV